MFVKGKTVQHSVYPTHNGVLSHAAAFLVTVGFVMYTSSDRKDVKSSELTKTIVQFIHLFSFSTWVGVQFWVHVSGELFIDQNTHDIFHKCIYHKIMYRYYKVTPNIPTQLNSSTKFLNIIRVNIQIACMKTKSSDLGYQKICHYACEKYE